MSTKIGEPKLKSGEVYLYFVKEKCYLHLSKMAKDNMPGFLVICGEYSNNEKHVCFIPESSLDKTMLDVYKKADKFYVNNPDPSINVKAGSGNLRMTPPKAQSLSSAYLRGSGGFSISLANLYSIQFRQPLSGMWHGSIVLNTVEKGKLPIVFFHDNEATSTSEIKKMMNKDFDPFGEDGQLYWGGQDFLKALKVHANVKRSTIEKSVYLVNPDLNDLRNFSPQIDSNEGSKSNSFRFSDVSKALTNAKWKILESIASFSTSTRTNVLDMVDKNAPESLKALMKRPEVQQMGEDFDVARVYLAKWAAQVKEEAEISEGKYMLPDALYKRINDELSNQDESSILTQQELFNASRRDSISEIEWKSLFDSSGHLSITIEELKNRIFHGGLSADIRKEAWPFLLGVYPWESSDNERRVLYKSYVSRYEELKLSWMTDEDKRSSEYWKDQKFRIEKDIHRTDRNLPIFKNRKASVSSQKSSIHEDESEDLYDTSNITNPHLFKMRDILITFNEHNQNLGYVQGMTDLLSPLYVVLRDEVLVFWAFVNFMERMERNFLRDQSGMKDQIMTLNKLVQFMLPEMYKHLAMCDSQDFFFFFRMLLVWFKREFEWNDVLSLWEFLWTDYHSSQFHLFVALSILSSNERVMIQNLQRFDEVLKYMNDLSYKMKLTPLMVRSELLFLRFKRTISLIDVKNEQLRRKSHQTDEKEIEVSPALRQLLSTEIIVNKEVARNPCDPVV